MFPLICIGTLHNSVGKLKATEYTKNRHYSPRYRLLSNIKKKKGVRGFLEDSEHLSQILHIIYYKLLLGRL